MIALSQVQLLEERISKAIEYVKRVKAENAALVSEKASLLSKLEANQKRIDELEVHVLRFKEDQGRIEDGIIAALDRLSQFEEAFENSLKDDKPAAEKTFPKTTEKPARETVKTDEEEYFEISDTVGESQEAELDIF